MGKLGKLHIGFAVSLCVTLFWKICICQPCLRHPNADCETNPNPNLNQGGTHNLYSASKDRTIKSWNVDEMGYVPTILHEMGYVPTIHVCRVRLGLTRHGTSHMDSSCFNAPCHVICLPRGSRGML